MLLAALLGAGFGGCYRGSELEFKQPPPGHAGGQCIGGECYGQYACITDESVCYDPADPCKGIYCSGYGTCALDIDTNIPVCVCDPGFDNELFAYFCTPIGL
jgi:hypothetical protein